MFETDKHSKIIIFVIYIVKLNMTTINFKTIFNIKIG